MNQLLQVETRHPIMSWGVFLLGLTLAVMWALLLLAMLAGVLNGTSVAFHNAVVPLVGGAAA